MTAPTAAEKLKAMYLDRFKAEWDAHIATMDSAVLKMSIIEYIRMESHGAAKTTKKRGAKKAVSRQSLRRVDDHPTRPAGRGESLFSVNGSPVVASSARESRMTRQSRRITLKGLDSDIELSCIIPAHSMLADQDDLDEDNSPITLAALEKEELVKMRDALKKAQQQAEDLLAQYGL
ncbi:hypothetical protein HDV03_002047 [Kappamyces sp. JEL0829]|nr:hypothetical protein HDV03_002047 [Kappamyces sp. JEL0829]